MFPRVVILEDLQKRLLGMKKRLKGALYGILYEKSMLLVGMAVLEEVENNLFPNGQSVQAHFPTGIDFCGGFAISDELGVPEQVKPILKEVMVTDNPVYIRKTRSLNEIVVYMSRNEHISEISFSIITQSEYHQMFTTLYMPVTLPLRCMNYMAGLLRAFDTLLGRLGNGDVIFKVDGTDLQIVNESSEVPTPDLTIEDVYKDATKMYLHLSRMPVMQINMLYTAQRSIEKEDILSNVNARWRKVSYESKTYNVTIKALCVTLRRRKIADCYGLLIDTACRSLLLYKFELERSGDPNALGKIAQYNFFPPSLGHLFSAVYDTRDMQYDKRQQYHRVLGLSAERPMFKIANSISFKVDPYQKSPLINVHEGVEASDKIGGQKFLITGYYEYYHYLQQNINDDGWGCAYRSLQTIFSWFRLQGYTSLDVPSHNDIQAALVQMGDKPAKFVGSRSWIGSTEVSYVLEHFLHVPSKILNICPGQDISSVSEELVTHFEVHGTPVMIGGGVLAHTILGIEYNKLTKEVRYLVLDPHYTGPDDVKIIQGKGWVSWKPKTFWKNNELKNLCLPIRIRCL